MRKKNNLVVNVAALFKLMLTGPPSPPPSQGGSLRAPFYGFPETGSSLGYGLNDFLVFALQQRSCGAR